MVVLIYLTPKLPTEKPSIKKHWVEKTVNVKSRGPKNSDVRAK
jgi:hypothetical protein